MLFEHGFRLENTYNESRFICMMLHMESVADQTGQFAYVFVCKTLHMAMTL